MEQADKVIWLSQERSINLEELISYHSADCYEKVLPKRYMQMTRDGIKHEKMKAVMKDILEWDYEKYFLCSIMSRYNGIGKSHIGTLGLKNYVRQQVRKDVNSKLENVDGKLFLKHELRRPYVQYITEADLYYKIQSTYNKEEKYGDNETKILNKYTQAEFLFLDDVFSNRINEFSRRVILYIIDKRCEQDALPTLITCNVDLEYIKTNIDSRIASRMSNKMLIKIEDPTIPDFRQLL